MSVDPIEIGKAPTMLLVPRDKVTRCVIVSRDGGSVPTRLFFDKEIIETLPAEHVTPYHVQQSTDVSQYVLVSQPYPRVYTNKSTSALASAQVATLAVSSTLREKLKGVPVPH